MFAHWEKYPPVHVTAALLAGVKPAKKKPAPREVAAPTADWIAEMPMLHRPRAGAAERARARAEGRL